VSHVPEFVIESRSTVWATEAVLTHNQPVQVWNVLRPKWLPACRGATALLNRLDEIVDDGASNTWQKSMTFRGGGYWAWGKVPAVN